MCLAQVVIIATMYIFTPLNMVLFSTLLGGDKNKPLAHDDDDDEDEKGHGDHEAAARLKAQKLIEKRERMIRDPSPKLLDFFKRFDELLLKPILIRDYENRIVRMSLLTSAQDKVAESQGDRGRRKGGPAQEDLLRPSHLQAKSRLRRGRAIRHLGHGRIGLKQQVWRDRSWKPRRPSHRRHRQRLGHIDITRPRRESA